MTDKRPKLVIALAIEPHSTKDLMLLRSRLTDMAEQDAAFDFREDKKTGQLSIVGISEEQLDSAISRLKGEDEIELTCGAPQVAYLETISKYTEYAQADVGKRGDAENGIRIKIAMEPVSYDFEYEFKNEIVDQNWSDDVLGAIEQGVKSALEKGPVAGFPVKGLRVKLSAFECGERDVPLKAIDSATRKAVAEGLLAAEPVLLEPIMKIEVMTPEEHIGEVIGDLNCRRGFVLDMTSGADRTITAMVPLANMFGYVNTLKHISQLRGHYTMNFDHYDNVPTSPEDDPPKQPAMIMRIAEQGGQK